MVRFVLMLGGASALLSFILYTSTAYTFKEVGAYTDPLTGLLSQNN
ncbi:MAG: hypothetical protein K2X98_00150 [Alphaproteobacteria bacterium]|nr:hypothetical protein [Alphaproteobacteria bacterium]